MFTRREMIVGSAAAGVAGLVPVAEAAPVFTNPLDGKLLSQIEQAEQALAGMKTMLRCAADYDAVRAGALFDMRCKLNEAQSFLGFASSIAEAQARELR